ncbi:MAG: 7-cyano-7-deazaguanine synthase QueC [Bdellovibrionales bacterium]|nr:7-cyano-7-deazaguanine synthase QueC [Bdellovibrionales bacterium]
MKPQQASALVILSGGQDSVTCLYWALGTFRDVRAISFDYGQRHKVELEGAAALCREEEVPHEIIQIDAMNQIAPSALTDAKIAVKTDGGLHNLPSTFVPGRNALFLTLSAAYAVSRGIRDLVIGACETDYSGYPDCREEFLASMEQSLSLGMGAEISIHRPLMYSTKAEIFALADRLGRLQTIVQRTHTCYEGVRTSLHPWGYGCGECPACVLRKRGFEEFKENLHGRS